MPHVHFKEYLKLIDNINDARLSVTLLLVKVVFYAKKSCLIVRLALKKFQSTPNLSRYQVAINGVYVYQFIYVP